MYNENNATNRDTPGKKDDGGIASGVVGSTLGTKGTSGEGGIASGVVGATVGAMLTTKQKGNKLITNHLVKQAVAHAKHGKDFEVWQSTNGNTPTKHDAPEHLP